MSEEGPYRGPIAPKPVKRVSTRFLFDYGYRRARENASVAAFRGGTLIALATAMLGIIEYATVPGALAHHGTHTDARFCIIGSVPFLVFAFTAFELYLGSIWLVRNTLKPSRERVKRWADAFSEIRSFNSACRRLRERIARFDAASQKERLAIVADAADLTKRRAEIARLAGGNHD